MGDTTGFPPAVHLRDHFTVFSEQLALLQTRKKSTTIRYRPGAVDLPCSDVLPLIVASGEGGCTVAGQARITSVTHRRYSSLTANEVWRDGFGSLAELCAALEGFYPGLDPQDWVTIYGIELLEATPFG